MEYVFVFTPNAEKPGQEKLRIRTLFTQCVLLYLLNTNSLGKSVIYTKSLLPSTFRGAISLHPEAVTVV